MARIRYIKPDVSLDEELATRSMPARLFFRDFWCHCDRVGRAEDRPLKLKALIFPYDDIDVSKLIDELTPHFIFRYEVDGKKYLQCRAFLKHQRPHVREPESTYPAPPKALLRHCLGSAEALPKPGQALLGPLDNGDGNGNRDGNGDRKKGRAPTASGLQPMGKQRSDLPPDYSDHRLQIGGEFKGVYVMSLTPETAAKALRTARPNKRDRAALEWRIAQKDVDKTPAQRAAAGGR